ncbi:MAG: CGNR zinc finger domain-containing protein [Candidatus Acidiferrum sp.]
MRGLEPMPTPRLLGGRLAVDFANTAPSGNSLTWPEFIQFLDAARIVSAERRTQLLTLPLSEAQAVNRVLLKVLRLRESLRAIFSAIVLHEKFPSGWIAPLNEILRVTEGHDELALDQGVWRMEFIAREDGLEWLLAAIARSGAEIIMEGAAAPLRRCANANCGLFFYDVSRTRRRRWCSMSLCGNRYKVAAFARRRKRGT